MGPGQPSIVVQPGTKGGGRPDLRIRLLSHALFGAPHSKSPEEHNGCLERDTEVARHKRAKLAEPVEEGSQNFRLLRSETKELDQLCNYQPHRVLAFLDASDALGFGFKQTPSFALEEDSVVFVSTRRAACCSSQRQGLPFLLTHQAFFFCTTSFPLPSYTKCIPFLYETRPPSLPTDQAFLFLKEEALSGSPEETRPLLYEKKPPSLPTDKTFLFLKEGTLSGSPKETRPLLYEKKRPSLPRNQTFLFLKEGTLSGSVGQWGRRAADRLEQPALPSPRSQGGAFKLRVPSRLSPPPTDDPDLVYLSFAPL